MNIVFITVIITLVIYWCIGFIISQINEEWAIFWAVGLIYPIIYIISYPIRAWKTYNNSIGYYRKHNVSRLQYLFGKRVNEED